MKPGERISRIAKGLNDRSYAKEDLTAITEIWNELRAIHQHLDEQHEKANGVGVIHDAQRQEPAWPSLEEPKPSEETLKKIQMSEKEIAEGKVLSTEQMREKLKPKPEIYLCCTKMTRLIYHQNIEVRMTDGEPEFWLMMENAYPASNCGTPTGMSEKAGFCPGCGKQLRVKEDDSQRD